MSYLVVLGKCLGLRTEIAKQLSYFKSVPQINQKMKLCKEKKIETKNTSFENFSTHLNFSFIWVFLSWN